MHFLEYCVSQCNTIQCNTMLCVNNKKRTEFSNIIESISNIAFRIRKRNFQPCTGTRSPSQIIYRHKKPWGPLGPDFQLVALGACLTLSFTPFGRSGCVYNRIDEQQGPTAEFPALYSHKTSFANDIQTLLSLLLKQ